MKNHIKIGQLYYDAVSYYLLIKNNFGVVTFYDITYNRFFCCHEDLILENYFLMLTQTGEK